MGSVTSGATIHSLDMLFSRWGLPATLTTKNGPGGEEVQSNPEKWTESSRQGGSETEYMSQTLLHDRAAHHSTTGVSPVKLMLGCELELPYTDSVP